MASDNQSNWFKRVFFSVSLILLAVISNLSWSHSEESTKEADRTAKITTAQKTIAETIQQLEQTKSGVAEDIVITTDEETTYYYDTIRIEKIARITKYVWTGNPMANGEYPYIGAVACSDYSLTRKGYLVKIDGQLYDIKDRTAKWVHSKHGLTFDIYTEETRNECLKFGSKRMEVEIYKIVKRTKKNDKPWI